MKKEKHRTRIAVGGNDIKHDGDIGTPTAHLETAKLLFNIVLSISNDKFMTINIANFYLITSIIDYEHLHIKMQEIPPESIKEYDL